jgi:hypothetical protein
MPVAVRRAVVARTGTNEAAGSGQRSARSDRRGMETLDVISVSPVPDGPFGHDLRYGRVAAGVNGVVHENRPTTLGSIHEFCTAVDETWTRWWKDRRRRGIDGRERSDQPPIANISIRGRSADVASVRISE